MLRKTFIRLSICFLASILAVAVLYGLSYKVNHSKNGFIRMIPPHMIGFKGRLDIKYNSFYFAGVSAGKVYLGNKTKSDYVLTVSHDLTDSSHFTLEVPDSLKVAWHIAHISIDSPHYYLTDYITPCYLSGNLPDLHPKYSLLQGYRFNIAIQMPSGSFIFRNYSRIGDNTLLLRQRENDPDINRFIIPKQQDGAFSTDGVLMYDRDSSRIVYLFHYRNQFLVLDTNMQLRSTGTTIDTVSWAKLKIATIKNKNEIKTTMQSPPILVNNKASISGNMLFVSSGLLANNENKETFDKSSVIDVYSLKNNEYKFSFYVPSYEGKKMSDFKVYGNTLFALCGQYLFAYQLKY